MFLAPKAQNDKNLYGSARPESNFKHGILSTQNDGCKIVSGNMDNGVKRRRKGH